MKPLILLKLNFSKEAEKAAVAGFFHSPAAHNSRPNLSQLFLNVTEMPKQLNKIHRVQKSIHIPLLLLIS